MGQLLEGEEFEEDGPEGVEILASARGGFPE